MAAAITVPQRASSLNPSDDNPPLIPRYGVLTLFGYGTRVHVDRGHLTIEDGIGTPRRQARLPRIGHGLDRLIVIGSDGMVSFSALRWLADQKAAFVMLDRDGSVLLTTGPVRPSDARLRRAQALAHHSGVALPIMHRLIDQKLAGQEWVAREALAATDVADTIQRTRAALGDAKTPTDMRGIEAKAAAVYWSAWRDVPVVFPRNDLARVPTHWRTVGPRHSPLTNAPRLAARPVQAVLNYLYALLEAEARLAASGLGLDPGMGILHADTDARDSFACDLMEPVRPQVDAYVLRWLARDTLRRDWFFEQRDGSCRLMAPLAVRLAETVVTWRAAVAPFAETVARMLWDTVRSPTKQPRPPTRLTQRHRRDAKGAEAPPIVVPPPPKACRRCGTSIKLAGQRYCAGCMPAVGADALREAGPRARAAAHTPDREAQRAATLRRHHAARRAWTAGQHPTWLTETYYRTHVQPQLAGIAVTVLVSAMAVSESYAIDVRAGRRLPHPRHWLALAQLVGAHDSDSDQSAGTADG